MPMSTACSRRSPHALGGLDALINNAGIAGPTGGVDEIDPGRLAPLHRSLPHRPVPLRPPRRADAEGGGGGSIVNMSSAAGRHGYAFRTPYSAAKFGVIGFTQSLAKELGPTNIRVNAILPGIVEGPRMEGVIRARAAQLGISYDEMEKDYLSRVSLRRMVSPARRRGDGRVPAVATPARISPASRSASTAMSRRFEDDMSMSKVAIIGSGFVGRAWAITFARAGHEVALWDADTAAPAQAIDFIARCAPRARGE